MQELKYIRKAEGGKTVIDVPAEFEGKELRIFVTEANDFKASEEERHC